MKGLLDNQESKESNKLSKLERGTIDFFCDGAKLLGLPKSLGEIYGYLYISVVPLSQDDLVRMLGMSKGSASQGLRTLKELGAIREEDVENSEKRRTYYVANVEMRRLVGGFIREQVNPHITSGQAKLAALRRLQEEEFDAEKRMFYKMRFKRLERWTKRSTKVLPVVQKLLAG